MQIVLDEIEKQVFCGLLEVDYEVSDILELVRKNNLVTVIDETGSVLFDEEQEDLIDLEGFNELEIEKEQTINPENENEGVINGN